RVKCPIFAGGNIMDFLCAQCGGNASQIVTDIDGTLYTQCLKCGELTPIKNTDELEEERRVIFEGRASREGHAASARPLASESRGGHRSAKSVQQCVDETTRLVEMTRDLLAAHRRG